MSSLTTIPITVRKELFFFLFIASFVFGQDGSVALKENIHLHLNKTRFLKGEHLWFTAYVQDQQQQLPAAATANLHIGIYSEDGEEVVRKLLYVENGVSYGDIAIDSMFVDEKYTVLAWTNYMRNFRELAPYRQKINVIQESFQETEEDDSGLFIEVYPEGGHFIQGAYNQIGIRVVDGLGRGVALKNLELVDGQGKVIRPNITTNNQGLGKTGFHIENDQIYQLQVVYSNTIVAEKILPKAITNQAGLNVENNGRDKVLFKLIASKDTFDEKDGAPYSLAVYQGEFMVFEEVELHENEAVISMDRASLPFGINTAVLFNEALEPVGWRMFFNHREEETRLQSVTVEHCLTEFKDSLQVDIILPQFAKQTVRGSLSILPYNSRAYNPWNSILSSFLLEPYVNTGIGNNRYYFEEMDRRKRYELDKRLMIEGWGKYDWDSRKMEEIQLDFELETGIPIKGNVTDANLAVERQLYVIAEPSGAMDFTEINNDSTFTHSMVLYDGDSLGISVIGEKGKLRKRKVVAKIGKEIIPGKALFDQMGFDGYYREGVPEEEVTDPAFGLGDQVIALEEVVLQGRVVRDNKTNMFVTGASEGIITEGRIIGDTEIQRYNSVMAYLGTLGYTRSQGVDRDGFFIDILLSPKSNQPVSFNGSTLNLPLSRVQAIYFDADKNKFVNVVLRSSPYERPEDRNRFVKFLIEKGYARPQEYFSANYPDYNSAVFKNFGVIHWQGDLDINSEIPVSITVPLYNQSGVMLYLEGMGKEGALLSWAKKIEIKDASEP